MILQADAQRGLAQIRAQFLQRLITRRAALAAHTQEALQANDAEIFDAAITKAAAILHKISGSAGTLGFVELGSQAQDCEAAILRALASATPQNADQTDHIILTLNSFIQCCDQVFSASDKDS